MRGLNEGKLSKEKNKDYAYINMLYCRKYTKFVLYCKLFSLRILFYDNTESEHNCSTTGLTEHHMLSLNEPLKIKKHCEYNPLKENLGLLNALGWYSRDSLGNGGDTNFFT